MSYPPASYFEVAFLGTVLALCPACSDPSSLQCGDGTVEVDGTCVVDSGGSSGMASDGDPSTTSEEETTSTTSSGTTTSDETTSDEGSSSGDMVPQTPLRVFTTRDEFTADLHGIDGADEICQAAADAAGLDGTFVVWLSTHEVDAIDRVGPGPWNRVDGELVFRDHGDLLDEALVPLTVDEYGDALPDELLFVRTGTAADGRRAVTPNCVGGGAEIEWNYDGPGPYGAAYGIPDVLEEWTNSQGAIQCDELARLYCFEVRE